jgi:hypothetical protein
MYEYVHFIEQLVNVVANAEEMNMSTKWVLRGRTKKALFELNRFLFSRVALPYNHQMGVAVALDNRCSCLKQYVQSFSHTDLTDRTEQECGRRQLQFTQQIPRLRPRSESLQIDPVVEHLDLVSVNALCDIPLLYGAGDGQEPAVRVQVSNRCSANPNHVA